MLGSLRLTTGNRILRVYVSQNQPNDDMKLLTNYIINVYAWFWFTVKAKPEFYNSPRHIFQMI